MALNPSTPPDVTYRFVIHATIDGHTAPLSIEATSLNEIRRAVRLLDGNGMIAEQQPVFENSKTDSPPVCNVHNLPMKPSKKPGAWFCSARLADGTYCDQKVG